MRYECVVYILCISMFSITYRVQYRFRYTVSKPLHLVIIHSSNRELSVLVESPGRPISVPAFLAGA
jgi:hypothetical protein